jgi:hypothetical protein
MGFTEITILFIVFIYLSTIVSICVSKIVIGSRLEQLERKEKEMVEYFSFSRSYICELGKNIEEEKERYTTLCTSLDNVIAEFEECREKVEALVGGRVIEVDGHTI